ncbi:MAG: hypothetical protein GY854_04465 [Deltaproteobacteria bacterium]|nr:hypothetical protein [Deltaproteobacteria bacterium]
MADDTIKKTSWDEGGKRWTLGGMAESMYEWLAERVPDETGDPTSIKGYVLAGTLDPDKPTVDNIPEPPKWLTPEIQMKAACVWHAASMQDYLIGSGLVPVAKGKILIAGSKIENLVGAIPEGQIKFGTEGTDLNSYLVVNDKHDSYPLTAKSAVFLQAIKSEADTFVTVKYVAHNHEPLEGGTPPFAKYKGWRITASTAAPIGYYFRIFI